MNRPLVWVTVALLLGTLCSAALGPPLSPALFPAATVAAFALAIIYRRDPRVRPFVVALIFFGMGALNWDLHRIPAFDPFSAYVAAHPDTTMTVRGTVREVQLVVPGDDTVRLTLDVEARKDGDIWKPVQGGAAVGASHAAIAVYPGDRVIVTGKPRVAIAEVNPGVNGYETYLRSRGVNSAIDAPGTRAITVVEPAPWYNAWKWTAVLREAEAEGLARAMPPTVLPFVYAVWLGHQSGIAFREYYEYVWSGTAHLLSVSGIHAAIVALTLNYALRMLQLSRRRRAGIVIAGVFLFTFMAGARVPAMRAAIMVCLYLVADLFEREPDTPTALSLAGLIFIVWDPRSVFDIGSQLSFASVASILIFAPLLEQHMGRVPQRLRGPLAVSLAVQILPLPIAAANFHALSLAAPAANLIVIPLMTLVLWLCVACVLFSFVAMPIAQIVGYATLVPVATIRGVAHFSAALRPLGVALTTPTVAAWVLYWIAAALLASATLVRASHRTRVLIIAGLVLVVSAVLWRPLRNEPEIVMLDVGHGDASFVRAPAGETILIDGGDMNDYADRGRQIVAPFLWARGVTRLDAIMVSHSDRDHIGGLIYVVDTFRVGTAILGATSTDRPLERELLAHCTERGTRVVRVHRGQIVRIGTVAIAILHPEANMPNDTRTNDLGIVARVPFGTKTVLYTGDIEKGVEASLDPATLRADILKVPHHGADTSSTSAFVDAVAPEYAVISTGSHGRRVLDRPIVERYQAKGISMLRTDRLGAIRFTLRHGELRAESERVNRGYPIAKD